MVSVVLLPVSGISQNLLKNGDFEEVTAITFKSRRNEGAFYANDWFQPTGCTVDIFRDLSACDTNHIKSFQPTLDYCVQTKSGDYCIGFIPINFLGYMEHLTGTLDAELEKGERYKVSFSIKKESSPTPYIPFGIGFKFHQDSILFHGQLHADKYEGGKLEPFYYNLFETNKIYADYQIDKYILDTNWVQYDAIYKAKGGEKYITFGRFGYESDRKIIRQFLSVRKNPWEKKIIKFINRDKSLVNRRFYDEGVPDDSSDYYFLDDIKIIKLKKNENGQTDKGSFTYCKECMYIDLDLSTDYSDYQQVKVDKGYQGLMTIDIYARLKSGEKFTLNYGKRNSIVIFSTNEQDGKYDEISYRLKYQARKLRKKPIVFSISKFNDNEFRNSAGQLLNGYREIYSETFKGVIKSSTDLSQINFGSEYPATWVRIKGEWRDFGGFLGW